jgi:tetratricopeptide (TPR) repeat protein
LGALAQLARCYLYLGKYRDGIHLVTPELLSRSRELATWAMLLYMELREFDKATAAADLATENHPTNVTGWYFAGCVYTASGQSDRARAVWHEGARKTEELLTKVDDPTRRVFLGLMYAKLGMRERALRQEQLALASSLNHPTM